MRCREVVSDEVYEKGRIAASASATVDKTKTKTKAGGANEEPSPSYIEALHPYPFTPGLRPPPPPPAPALPPKVQEAIVKGATDATKKKGVTAESIDVIKKALKSLLGDAADVEILELGDNGIIKESPLSDSRPDSDTVQTGTDDGAQKAHVPGETVEFEIDPATELNQQTIAELLGRSPEDILQIDEEDGRKSFYVLENFDGADRDDVDAIGKKFFDQVAKRKAAAGGEVVASSGDDEDDYVPETHDEL